jgi:hypothetical protein
MKALVVMGALATVVGVAFGGCTSDPNGTSPGPDDSGGATGSGGDESGEDSGGANHGGPGSGGESHTAAGTNGAAGTDNTENSGGSGGESTSSAGGDGGSSGNQVGDPYSYTPTVDGSTDDWPLDARLGNSSGSYTYVAWDSDNLYIGQIESAIYFGSSSNWLVIYSGNGEAGTTTGLEINTQEPTLPFEANRVVLWKVDDTYSALQTWNGSDWDVSTPFFGQGDAELVKAGSTAELTIPREALGLGDDMMLVIAMVNETTSAEFTFGASPGGAITNLSYDPDYAHYYDFDLTTSDAPVTRGTAP